MLPMHERRPFSAAIVVSHSLSEKKETKKEGTKDLERGRWGKSERKLGLTAETQEGNGLNKLRELGPDQSKNPKSWRQCTHC